MFDVSKTFREKYSIRREIGMMEVGNIKVVKMLFYI